MSRSKIACSMVAESFGVDYQELQGLARNLEELSVIPMSLIRQGLSMHMPEGKAAGRMSDLDITIQEATKSFSLLMDAIGEPPPSGLDFENLVEWWADSRKAPDNLLKELLTTIELQN
jgi:hypothetical protein